MSIPSEPFFRWLCRTCMHQQAESSYDAINKLDQDWPSIFDIVEEVGNLRIDQLMSTTIPQIVEVEENDDMPKKICSKCFEQLLSLHRFQELCVQTDQKLRALITKRNCDLQKAITEGALENEIDTKDLIAKEALIVVNEQRIEYDSINTLPENQVDPLQGLNEIKIEPSEDNQSNVVYSAAELVHEPNTENSGKSKVYSLEAEEEQVSLPDEETQRTYSETPDKNVTKKVCNICDKMLCSSFSLKRHKRIYHTTEKSNKPFHRIVVSEKNEESIVETYEQQLSSDDGKQKKVHYDRMEKSTPTMVCNICEKTLCGPFSLKRHKRIYHSAENSNGRLHPAKRSLLSVNREIARKASDVHFLLNDPGDEVSNVFTGGERMHSSVSQTSEVFTAEEDNEQLILAEPQQNEKIGKARYACDICERILSSTFSLKRHKKLCHSSENANASVKRFTSVKCSTFFSNNKVMKNKPCVDECNVEYIGDETIHAAASAKNEVLTVDAVEEQIILDDVKRPRKRKKKADIRSRKRVCDVCEKTLSSTFSLKRHKMFYHPIEKEMERVNQLPCDMSSNNEMLAVENEGEIVSKYPGTLKESNGVYNPDEVMHSTVIAKNEALTPETELEQVTFAIGQTQRLQSEKIYKKIPKTCDICRKTLSSMYSLKRHKLIYHSTETPGRQVRLWYTRDGSAQIARDKKPKKKCDICKKMLSSAYALNRHKRIYHSTEHSNNTVKYYPCKFCGKVLKSSLSLSVHLRRHVVERPYLCAECGKAFRQANLLKQHMFRHSNDKSFECPYCPLKFRCPNDVSKHKIIHEGIKRHICDICGDSFGKSNQLVLHKRYHNNEKPYQCEYCNMRFHRLSTMRRHMLTHTGERPYKCKYCKRSFAQSNDHVKHLRIHLGENVYRCKLCPLRFRLASEMRLHFATHKNEDPETRERNIKALKEAEAELKVKLAESTGASQ